MGWPIRNWENSVPNWPRFPFPRECLLLLPSFFLFFPLFIFFFSSQQHDLPPFTLFRASKLCMHCRIVTRGSQNMDVGGGEARQRAVGSKAETPLGGPRLSDEFLDDPTIGSPWFHVYSIALLFSFPSIRRSTIENFLKNSSFFLQSKDLELDLGQTIVILEVTILNSHSWWKRRQNNTYIAYV